MKQFGIPGSLVPLDEESRELVIGEPTIGLDFNIQTIPTVDRWVLQDTTQQYDQGAPNLVIDPFWNSLMTGQNDGMNGLGADEVRIEKAQPVRKSTVYLVVGGAALVVATAAAYWFLRKK
jgi:hypothetical protein